MANSDSRRDELLRSLAEISAELESQRSSSEGEWVQSPFRWFRRLPSRSRGAEGENLVAAWCERLGYAVGPTGDSEADRMIAGRRVEIKLSTLWANGRFKFQQIRDQDYEIMICIGLTPRLEDVQIWAIPKETLMKRPVGVSGQHSGADATETLWLDVRIDSPPPWLAQWGGDLDQAEAVLADLFSA